MRNWISQHRKLAIWLVAGLAVGAVLILKSRLAGAATTSTADTGTAATGTVSSPDPSSDYATGYDSGFTAGQGSTTAAGTVATSGTIAGPTIYGYGKKHNPFYSLAAYKAALKRNATKRKAATVKKPVGIKKTGHPVAIGPAKPKKK